MSETIEIEVGTLYAEMHERYSTEVGEQYTERVRAQTEDFLHQFNQQMERQQEQVQQQQEEEELSLSEDELEAVEADE